MKKSAGTSSRKLSLPELREIMAGGIVLERDKLGEKVVLTSKKRILKLFRPRSLFSSQLWNPYASRFVRNAEILRRRDIQAPAVEAIYSIPELNRQAILYPSIEGESLRSFLSREKDADKRKSLLLKTAAFLAEVHEKGVLFRGLHFGNVITTPSGGFALIDIIDIKVRRRGQQSARAALQNFRHVARYAGDREKIEEVPWSLFLETYRLNRKTGRNFSGRAFERQATAWLTDLQSP
ncbi:MAG: hypothetical protein WD490_00780 [Opitutales bacterium]